MKNKKAVKSLVTINVLAMLTMLGQPVVKAQQPKEEYLVEINETNFPDNLLRRYMNLVVDSNQNGKIEQDEVQKIKYLKLGEYEGEGELEKFTNLGDEGVNLKVKSGETIGVIGGTGSGKTTLVNMIPGFYYPTEGTLSIEGADIKEFKKSALQKKISIVPQKALLFKGTIRSNLLWGNEDATEEELTDALKKSQSYDFVMEKENGIDSYVAQTGKNFSGGQKQRLTIARALVKKPEILILDDSSSALDFATEVNLRKAIKSLANVTTFIVSQRTSSIMDADQIVVLDDGKVVGIGKHEQLLETCEVYKEIYQSQFKNSEKEGR